ncbi:DUF4328 domain-containing protein [Streptomyces sp. NPDC059785]|uniref:DUF4328 domain-containing protein n=1 Tax=unclassified Streptomyces TaxID=2593676 RepID=UPI0036646EB7
MLCAHCRHFDATPGQSLCGHCAAVTPQPAAGPPPAGQPAPAGPPPVPGGLPTAPPLGAAPPQYGPPQYATPSYTGHGTAWLRSPVALGRANVILLGTVIATDLLAVAADLNTRSVADELAGGNVTSALQDKADRADVLYAASGVVQVVALIAAAVVFLVWFHRTRVNAEVFDASAHSKSRGWTCWSWFVPVVNFWFPRRIAVDIWNASSPVGTRRPHGIVNVWWGFWLFSLLAGRAAYTSYNQADTAAELRSAASQMLFSDLMDAVAAVFAIVVVLRLTRMQDEKAHGGGALFPA